MNTLFRKAFFITMIAIAGSSCNAIKSIPTNTTGGLFSLNGSWQLSSTTDGTALTGTTISVLPVVGNAGIKTIANNTYCLRVNDQIWKSIKANNAGGFTISTLVSACNGNAVYKEGTIAVVNDNKITVTSRTATNSELIQAWERVK